MRKLFYQLMVIMLIINCEKVKYYPDKSFEIVETKFLAHRGCGNSKIQENTLEAAKYGLERLDGIEVDICISKDRTLWLSHNVELEKCGEKEYDCFPETFDSEIEELDSCLGNEVIYTRLEEIFLFMSVNYPHKYISLDIKDWVPCKWTSLDIIGIHKVIADELISLANKYEVSTNIMVESQIASFLSYIQKKENSIETYLTTFGDFERGMLIALEGGFSGISFKYKYDEEINVNHIEMIRKKGLKIQLWTVNNETDIEEAFLLNPDFIQTDNVNYILNNIK